MSMLASGASQRLPPQVLTRCKVQAEDYTGRGRRSNGLFNRQLPATSLQLPVTRCQSPASLTTDHRQLLLVPQGGHGHGTRPVLAELDETSAQGLLHVNRHQAADVA